MSFRDGTIVSGDSTGATIFWDPLTGTPLAVNSTTILLLGLAFHLIFADIWMP